MKTSFFFAGAAMLALGTTAFAQSGGERNAPTTRSEVIAKVDARFAKMDANGDGVVNEADRAARQAQRFAKLDTNNDGELTPEELRAGREMRHDQMRERRADRPAPTAEQQQKWADARAKRAGKGGDRTARMAERFAARDVDGNGTLSLAEFSARPDRADRPASKRAGHRGHHRGAKGMMNRADANKDGTISIEEMRTAALARFDKVDRDGDGTISAAERQAARDARKARRQAASQDG